VCRLPNDEIPYRALNVSNRLSTQSLVPQVTAAPCRQYLQLRGRPRRLSVLLRGAEVAGTEWLTNGRMPQHRELRSSVLLVAVANSHALTNTIWFIIRIQRIAAALCCPSEMWQISLSLQAAILV